jgi:hypothetical protein
LFDCGSVAFGEASLTSTYRGIFGVAALEPRWQRLLLDLAGHGRAGAGKKPWRRSTKVA